MVSLFLTPSAVILRNALVSFRRCLHRTEIALPLFEWNFSRLYLGPNHQFQKDCSWDTDADSGLWKRFFDIVRCKKNANYYLCVCSEDICSFRAALLYLKSLWFISINAPVIHNQVTHPTSNIMDYWKQSFSDFLFSLSICYIKLRISNVILTLRQVSNLSQSLTSISMDQMFSSLASI